MSLTPRRQLETLERVVDAGVEINVGKSVVRAASVGSATIATSLGIVRRTASTRCGTRAHLCPAEAVVVAAVVAMITTAVVVVAAGVVVAAIAARTIR